MSEILTGAVSALISEVAIKALTQLSGPEPLELETLIHLTGKSLGLNADDSAALLSALEMPSVQLLASAVIDTAIADGPDSKNFSRMLDTTGSDFAEIVFSDRRLTSIKFGEVKDFWLSFMTTLSSPYEELGFNAHDLAITGNSTEQTVIVTQHNDARLRLARNSARLAHLIELSQQISSVVHQKFSELRISHAMEEHRRAFTDLYVPRDLQFVDGSIQSAAELDVRRLIITGPPGVGKSTFVTQLLRMTEGKSGPSSTPMLLRAREAQPSETIVKSLTRSMKIQSQREALETAEVEDLLTLGLGLVVFDGIDEIRNLPRRRQFVTDIESFARKYPTTKIVVTSREIGYESSPLSKDLFKRAALAPFSIQQVHDYAIRWFTPFGKPGLLEGFERDVQSLDEIKTNPLMLSLLCTLYTARGYLPTNRRLVYEQCTQLLFHRWDSMRQIEQPSDLRNYGPDLMQDLAHLYYRSPNAQAGLQERVLQGVVEHFFMDTAGVLPIDARTRAKDFLEFCADRAWLLGVAGVDDIGERIFTFTHQTFLEFFASEALARERETSQLADDIIDAYEKNTSSLVPELIVQSSEAARRRSGVEILQVVKEKERLIGGRGAGRFLALRIRLVAASKPGPQRLDEIFKEALDSLFYTSESGGEMATMSALLMVSEDQRNRLHSLMLDPETDSRVTIEQNHLEEWREGFLSYWSALELARETLTYEHDWREFIVRLRSETPVCDTSAWTMRVQALESRIVKGPLLDADLGLVYHFGDLRFAGPATQVLRLALNSEIPPNTADAELLELMEKRLHQGIDTAEGYDLLREVLSASEFRRGSDSTQRAESGKILLPFYCASLELAEPHQADSIFSLSGAASDMLQRGWEQRERSALATTRPSRVIKGGWFVNWRNATFSFVHSANH